MPPKQLSAFDYREFKVVIAKDGALYIVIARNAKGQTVYKETDHDIDELRREMKTHLNELSHDFIGFGGGINLFRKAFPGGFHSPFFEHYERNYKNKTAGIVCERLSQEQIDKYLESGKYGAVAEGGLAAIRSSNLCFPNEKMKITEALKDQAATAQFAPLLRELLYGDFNEALERLGTLLKPFEANKWPILTFLPFFRFPDRHMFLKPQVTQNCAERLGFDLRYDSTPNLVTYRSLLEFTKFVRKGISELKPRDNIDVQTFFYAVGTPDYVKNAISDREKFEAETITG